MVVTQVCLSELVKQQRQIKSNSKAYHASTDIEAMHIVEKLQPKKELACTMNKRSVLPASTATIMLEREPMPQVWKNP